MSDGEMRKRACAVLLAAFTSSLAACGSVKFVYKATHNAENIVNIPTSAMGGNKVFGHSIDQSTALLRVYKLTAINNEDGNADFVFNSTNLYTCQDPFKSGDKPVCKPPAPSGCPVSDPSKCNCKMDNLLMIRKGKNAPYQHVALTTPLNFTVKKGKREDVDIGLVFWCRSKNGEQPASGSTKANKSWTPLRYYDDDPSFVYIPSPSPDPKYQKDLDFDQLP